MDNLVLIFKSIFYMGISSTLIILIILLVKKIFNKTLTTKWHYYIWILLIIRLTTPFYVQGNVSVHNFLYPIVEKVSMTNKIMYSVQNSKVSFTDNKEKNTVNSISNKKILKVNKNYSSLWVKASYLWISVLILIFAYILLVNIFVTVKIKAYKESFQNRILFH
ncbi:M56 family metallopeptidase [Clostridium felsineum]|uniref:Uncharacterized protein n=1 Tax=Clostridium felsineum TaxID=36839 RepID=A0A1S8LWY0_9CLOT|nr:M56 family metallopeptidase [Clostridium felsineum]URZ08346.1 hypothetical protein CLROS_037280 [Clostridium felsineum]URZ13377.1 hypothetical protein CROST_041430 [Clostridium felsineum]